MTRDWLSAHVYYNGIQSRLLLNCIEPLVLALRAQQLIQHYFFIRYWEAGFHIRLRLLPAAGVSRGELQGVVDRHLQAYLTQYPSVYPNPAPLMSAYYSSLFEMEYGKDELLKKYGESGRIPYMPNNSVQYIDYQPEYARYGGSAGMELAEEHFEASSDIVLWYLKEINVRVPAIVLGRAIQLMYQMAYVTLGDDARCGKYFGDYSRYWDSLSKRQDQGQRHTRLESAFQAVNSRLHERLAHLKTQIDQNQPGEAGATRGWLDHVRWLDQRLKTLLAEGRLEFPERIKAAGMDVEYLIGSYLHMTNNRLGVRISDESHLSYLLHRRLSPEGSIAAADQPPAREASA